ncbi:MAG: tRNA uridine(34) 5-carboxymethylaminomethyl modification radical SAM/GNAT enzyme Elp3 [Candidatus Magasanikbacteria bacterium]
MNIAQQIILSYLKNPNREMDSVRRDVLRGQKSDRDIAKSDLLKAYHELLKKGKITKSVQLEKMLIKRGVRTLSGVAIVTVLTKPWKCPGKCIYCPDEARMPKSYLSDEPAAARALTLKFDPYEQVARRIETLRGNGHPTDKIELIVKGGSWNAYPLDYQYWFIGRCFEAANTARCHSERSPKGGVEESLSLCKSKGSFATLRMTTIKLQKKNETAKHRIVGLTLETRPDLINENTVEIMRELGCTRIEMGIQTTDDKILKIIKRGHDSASVKTATRLLKNYGFKVDYHLMPQLPGSTPQKDLAMMLKIFDDPDYRPDMIKIYPCTVIKGTELYQWLKKGKYKPYSDKKLIELLIKIKTAIPRYVRISRLIRDIPSHHIMGGNIMTNLRQVIQAKMKERKLKCNCLRCREAGHNIKSKIKYQKLKIFIDKYTASNGTEYFLSCEDPTRQVVYAFCRLRINPYSLLFTPYPAFIRELHTYGQLISLKQKNIKTLKQKDDIQHTGLGRALMLKAEEICRKQKIDRLAVISGIGVRDYYKKLGYRLENGYMIKKLS